MTSGHPEALVPRWPSMTPTVGKDPQALSVARGLRRRLCAAASGSAQTSQPGSGAPRRGSRQTHTDKELLIGYVVPFLPCPPAKRATDSDLLDLPLTTSGARSTGMLHLPEVCGEPERRAALLCTTSAHLLRTASSRSRLHARARMPLRVDEHLTVRRALRPWLHGESAGGRCKQPGRDRALYCVGQCRQQ